MSGPIKVEASTTSKLGDYMVKAGKELGYRHVLDYNGERQEGKHFDGL